MGLYNTLESGTKTATANGTTLEVGDVVNVLRVQLAVTARSGTSPTLDVTIQDTVDDGTNWNTIGTFAQKTNTGTEVINITAPFTNKIRARSVIAGTNPSFTYSVVAYAE